MGKPPILPSPEEDAELKRLYADLAHASRRATANLRVSGMTSAAFLRADREVTRIVKRIKEIRGLAGKHWMAL
jgi:hypothetical protein